MGKITDIKIKAAKIYFLPVKTRVPLKFGLETLTSVTCVRVCLTVEDKKGRYAEGWGETPLSVQWAWPSSIAYEERHKLMKEFCIQLGKSFVSFNFFGHPIELGYTFQKELLPELLSDFNKRVSAPLPYLASLVCCSAFDIAIHDGYGVLHDISIYKTYNENFMNYDLSRYITPSSKTKISFKGKYPSDFFTPQKNKMVAWHLVGGKDPLDASELTGEEPKDNYPVLLSDWIKQDGLKCLKVKLKGNDKNWDLERLVKVGKMAINEDVWWISTDFNCTVTDPEYVNEILDKLMLEYPKIYGMILYVEQPFPYELEEYPIDVHSVSGRKPLFMDESAHNWELVKLGRQLGWTGVALKTCKTQTGALLTLCWAKAHGMGLMVQDLTNPMLAQIPHVLLASYAGTIMGVETNSMQFYPDASLEESKVHPGIYRRRNGCVDLSTIKGPGFGYCIEKIQRLLPEPVFESS